MRFFFLILYVLFLSTEVWSFSIKYLKKRHIEVRGVIEFGNTIQKTQIEQSQKEWLNNLWSYTRITAERYTEFSEAFLSYELFSFYQFKRNTLSNNPQFVFQDYENKYRIWDFSEDLVKDEKYKIKHQLNQFYYKKFLTNGEVILGRQIISLGTARGISPLDIFTNFNQISVENKELPGVDAILLKHYFSFKTTELELNYGIVGGKDKIIKNGGMFLKLYYSSAPGDFKFLSLKVKDWYVIGLACEVPIRKAGMWFDGGVFLKNPYAYFRSSLGIEYFLFQEIYFFLEYYYNQAKEKILEITFQPPEKEYLITGLKWDKDLFKTSLYYGKSLASKNYFYQIQEEVSLDENLFLTLGSSGDYNFKLFYLKLTYYY